MAFLDLEKPPKTPHQLLLEAESASRALNDAVLVGFLHEMRDDAAGSALFADTVEEREQYRIKVIAIAELLGRLANAARFVADAREDNARAPTFE